MERNYRVWSQPGQRVSSIHILAGIGVMLFPLLHVYSAGFNDFERDSPQEAMIPIINLIAHVLLFPLAYALYKELSTDSPPLSAGVSLLSIIAPTGIALEALSIINSETVTNLAASVWLQRPIFLVFGALGCYGYVSYLTFRKFGGNETFPIALALIGILIVLSAVAYQKYVSPWLEARVGRLQAMGG